MQSTTFNSSRRRFLETASISIGLGISARGIPLAAMMPVKPAAKSVAAIVTIYRKNSHADVLIGKILEGWKQDGGDGPALVVKSMYVDQFPADDMSVVLAKKHGVRLCKTIREAIELGSGHVAVDGVISVGEHGDYPWNDKQQHLYPRKRFFEEITACMESSGKVVPIFNDKHPGPEWDDAKWMYDRAAKLNVPWMAGSSLVVSTRDPDVTLPFGSELESSIAVGYSGLDIYGFHTLDYLQAIIERRRSPKTGVKWVQNVPINSIPDLIGKGQIDRELLELGLKSSGTELKSVMEGDKTDTGVFLVQYLDGLLVPVVMLSGIGKGISVVCKTRSGATFAARTEERPEPRYPHFAYLLKGIEQMIHTGKPAYPVERTLLAAGILDRALTSRRDGNQRIETPELDIQYTPVDYSYAPHLDLEAYAY